MVAFLENDEERKMVVPIHWIQGDTLMYPPKGKVVGEFVWKLTPVEKLTWRHYSIIKIIKEKASLTVQLRSYKKGLQSQKRISKILKTFPVKNRSKL